VIGLRKAESDLGLPPKALFKEAVRGLVPDWVHVRPKRGFQVPMRAWHRALFAAHGRSLEDGMLVQLGILRPEAARRFAAGSYSLRETNSFAFTALVLEAWCRRALSPR